MTVVYCSEGSKQKKCCTLYEHQDNQFPSDDLETDEESSEEEEEIEVIEETIDFSKKKKKMKKIESLEISDDDIQ